MADSTTSTLRAEPGTTRKSRDLDVQSGTSKGKTGDDEAALVGDEVADTSLGISPDSDDKEASLEKGIPLSPVKEEAPSFPDGGYGWVIVACGVALSAVTWGINSSFGVFLSFYIQNDYFPGATNLQFAFVGGLSLSCAMLVGPVSNYLSKRWGVQATMAIGSCFLAGGQIAAAFATQMWHLFLTQGVCFALGLGFIMVSNQPIVAQWFGKKRALASGIVGGGSGVGGLIFSNLSRYLIEHKGLKWAFLVNGIASAAVMLPVTILMKPRSKPLKARFEPFKVGLFRNPGFLSIVAWGCLLQFSYLVGLYTIPPYATDGLGFTQTQGSTLQSLLSAGQIIGRPLCGLLLDRIGRFNGASVVSIAAGFTCLFIWMFARSMAVLGLFAVLQGGLGGIFWISNAVLLTEMVGIRDLSSAVSMLWLAIVIPATVCEPIAILLREQSISQGKTGAATYQGAIGFAGAFFVAAGLALLGAKFYKQKSLKWVQKT